MSAPPLKPLKTCHVACDDKPFPEEGQNMGMEIIEPEHPLQLLACIQVQYTCC